MEKQNESGLKIVQIVLTDLGSEKLILEEELQRVINQDIDTKLKLSSIKKILKKITTNENITNKFIGYIGLDTKN